MNTDIALFQCASFDRSNLVTMPNKCQRPGCDKYTGRGNHFYLPHRSDNFELEQARTHICIAEEAHAASQAIVDAKKAVTKAEAERRQLECYVTKYTIVSEFNCHFEASPMPPAELNIVRLGKEKVVIKSTIPSYPILFPTKSSNEEQPGCPQRISSEQKILSRNS